MATLDDVLNSGEEYETEAPEQGAEVAEPATQQVEEGEGAQPNPEAETTAAPSNDKHVPLAALEAERKGRQDWKEKAIRFEEEAKQLRERMQAQPAEQRAPLEPIQQVREEMLNHRFNTSEMLARSRHADLDDVMVHFREAAQANPALGMQLLQVSDPYEFAYTEGRKAQMFKDIGNDPAAYRAKLEAEIRASLQAQPEASAAALAAAAPANRLPTSLAGARSAASRQSSAFTGPAPLDSMFRN